VELSPEEVARCGCDRTQCQPGLLKDCSASPACCC
jgi:hypothetical protein